MGMNRNQAYRAFRRKRPKLFLDACNQRTVAALACTRLRGNQIAVFRLSLRSRCDFNSPADLLLVDWLEVTSAGWPRSKNTEYALPRAIDDLDHPAAVPDRVFLLVGR